MIEPIAIGDHVLLRSDTGLEQEWHRGGFRDGFDKVWIVEVVTVCTDGENTWIEFQLWREREDTYVVKAQVHERHVEIDAAWLMTKTMNRERS